MRVHILAWTVVATAIVVAHARPAEAQLKARPVIWQGEPAEWDQPAGTGGAVGDNWIGEGDCSWSGGPESCGPDRDAGGCGAGGCGAGRASSGFWAGVEATYLKPEIQNGSFFSNPDYDYQAAPRIWLGWQGQSGWGIRGRYWDLDAETQSSDVVVLTDTTLVQTLDEDLRVYAIDLEATRAFSLGRTGGVASFGARHGRLQRQITQHDSLFDLAGGGGDDASVILQEFDRGIDGTGFTMALDLRRPIGQSRLAAICNLRGSVIWGSNELDLLATVIEVVPVGAGDLDLNDFQQLRFRGTNGKGMWIGEFQAGGEWWAPCCTALAGASAFLRVVFEGQWWDLPGASTISGPSAGRQLHEFIGVTAAAGIQR